MRRLLHLDERFEPVQTARGAKWDTARSLRSAVDLIYRDAGALARAVKANDEQAADAAAAEFLSKWPDLEKSKTALENAFAASEPERAAA